MYLNFEEFLRYLLVKDNADEAHFQALVSSYLYPFDIASIHRYPRLRTAGGQHCYILGATQRQWYAGEYPDLG